MNIQFDGKKRRPPGSQRLYPDKREIVSTTCFGAFEGKRLDRRTFNKATSIYSKASLTRVICQMLIGASLTVIHRNKKGRFHVGTLLILTICETGIN